MVKKNKIARITRTTDRGAIIVGATSMQEAFPSQDPWILELDASAEVYWTRIISTCGRYDGVFDVEQLADSGYLVAGYSQSQQTQEMNFDNLWLARLSSEGDSS